MIVAGNTVVKVTAPLRRSCYAVMLSLSTFFQVYNIFSAISQITMNSLRGSTWSLLYVDLFTRSEPPRVNLPIKEIGSISLEYSPMMSFHHGYYNYTGAPVYVADRYGSNFCIPPTPHRNEGRFVIKTEFHFSGSVDFDPLDLFRNAPVGMTLDMDILKQQFYNNCYGPCASIGNTIHTMEYLQEISVDTIERAGGSVLVNGCDVVVSFEDTSNSQEHPEHARMYVPRNKASKHIHIWRNTLDELPDTHYVEIGEVLHPIENRALPKHPEGYWVIAGGKVKNYGYGDIMSHLSIFRSVQEYEASKSARSTGDVKVDNDFRAMMQKLTASIRSVADVAEALQVSNKLMLRAEALEKAASKVQADEELSNMKVEIDMLKNILIAVTTIFKMAK